MSTDLRVKNLIRELKLLSLAYEGKVGLWSSEEIQSLIALHLADNSRIQLSFAKGQRLSRIAIQEIVLQERQKALRDGQAELLAPLDRILRNLGYIKKNKPKKI